MSTLEGPPPANGTTVDAGAGTAAPAPLPIGGLLWIPGVYLGFVTLMMFGQLAKVMPNVSDVPGAAPASGAAARGYVSPVAAAILLANFAVPFFLSIKFFQRRRYIPLFIIAWSLLGLVSSLGQGLPARALVFKFGSAALLVSYFSLSQRVKRTFLL